MNDPENNEKGCHISMGFCEKYFAAFGDKKFF